MKFSKFDFYEIHEISFLIEKNLIYLKFMKFLFLIEKIFDFSEIYEISFSIEIYEFNFFKKKKNFTNFPKKKLFPNQKKL